MSLEDMAQASEEKKLQRIMRLRNDFNHRKVITLRSAVARYGYSLPTVKKWAKQGNIPLLQDNGEPIVPVTEDNSPAWLKGGN